MTLDEDIEYEEETADEEAIQIADWLKVLKDIQSTGSCNTCNNHSRCKYEPEAGQMVRYNCPFYKEGRREMPYGEIYDEFCKKCPDAEVKDFRPAIPMYCDSIAKPIPNAIILWLKDGTKVVYMAESDE